MDFSPLYNPHSSHERLFYSVLSPALLIMLPKSPFSRRVCKNIKFASSFQEEELISESVAVKKDKPFLLSVLSSVGSLCDAVAMAACRQLARRLLVMPSS